MHWDVADTLDYVDWSDPVNWDNGLNRGLVAWYLAVPGHPMGWGTTRWRDLCHRYPASLASFASPATSTSGWSTAQGRRGGFGSLRCDGSNDIATATGFPATTSAYTVALWILPTTVTSGAAWVTHDSGANNGWRVSSDTSGRLRFSFGGVANYDFTTLSLTANVWQFAAVACTGNSGTATGYVAGASGALANQALSTGTLSGTPSQISIGGRAGSTFMSAWIDDVRIWNRALSEREIAQVRLDSMSGYNDTIRRVDPWLSFPEYYSAAPGSGGPFPWFFDDLSGGFQTLGMGSI